ncbi:hypothetical protein [Pelagibaculum spongiae]|uniref:Uncharacterized protein n=1 Tax=Pelagibaculum spongiae TaxID=2080658 RepID=A0A2V1H096_9GAMM|nr:hypothetical protein [Pelagibaculum spongiae]PVZ72089.1 hypothetical protein DC094_03460 [Pelagibaculum spongiae]
MKYRKIEIQISDDKTFYILLEKEAWKTIGTSCLSFARRVKYKTIAAPVGTSDSYIKSYIEAPSVGAVPWNGIQTQISEISDAGYFLIAVYLGKLDSHFIRLCSDAWYHTHGTFLQMGKKF